MNAPHAFVSPKDLPEPTTSGQIPALCHRTLLYDANFPANVLGFLSSFYALHLNFTHVLWRRDDVLAIMTPRERHVYHSYERNVQRADFARYVILKKYGGMYVDFDIAAKQSLTPLYEANKDEDAIVFIEEITSGPAHIWLSQWFNYRKGLPESTLRVGQCIFFCQPQSKVVSAMVDLCIERSSLKVLNDDDILYTTGPDVARTVVERGKAVIIPYALASTYFIHMCAGHWR